MIPIRERLMLFAGQIATEQVLQVLERSVVAVKEAENIGVVIDISPRRTIEQMHDDTKKELLERSRDALNVELENYES